MCVWIPSCTCGCWSPRPACVCTLEAHAAILIDRPPGSACEPLTLSFPPAKVFFASCLQILALFTCVSCLCMRHDCISPPLNVFLDMTAACFLQCLVAVGAESFSTNFVSSNKISCQSSAARSVETPQLSHQILHQHPRVTSLEWDAQCCHSAE
jgi:hypothetical protein